MTARTARDRGTPAAAVPARAPALGAVDWFRPGEHERVERALEAMRRAGIRHLRTGVSWAECHAGGGWAWYDWLLPRLAREVEVLPCFTYTPPSLGVVPKTSAPPRDRKAYADFLDVMITAHGEHFKWVELWNEPSNLDDWDWRLDPQWHAFAEMVGGAAYWARQRGKKTVLGGICPTDPNWLALMAERRVLDHVDAVGLHAFPDRWEQDWRGWRHLVGEVREVLEGFDLAPELWATGVGYSTWRHDEGRQIPCLLQAVEAPLQRVYWYALQDLDPEIASQQGFHLDERHYHFGLLRADGSGKILYRLLEAGGVAAVRASARLAAPALAPATPRVVVTGGAGFIGANLADRLARSGERVLIYDSLARPGVEDNARWLKERHRERVQVEIGDVRDGYHLRDAVRHASVVFHLAAQVAVTTSLEQPALDFEVNARGTLNLLEELRRRSTPPPLVFTSTNKVYGGLGGLAFEACSGRYAPVDPAIQSFGVGEQQPLDFCSPYGCSKGAADQYVLDFAGIYGLPATVFRMSCIYGPRQFGTEDQGWVAHFLRQAIAARPITIYGDGQQVRDVLYVDDLVEAFLLARDRTPEVRGRAFNIGGGPGNAVSLIEVLRLIERLQGRAPQVASGPWRPGDQVYYVSDTRAFQAVTGWRPAVDARTGIARLWRWLRQRDLPLETAPPVEEAAA